jgi:hypothetical protein
VLVLLATGCAKKSSSAQAALQLAAPPADMSIKLGIEFDGAIELLGAKVTPAQGLKPASRVELTLYWRKTGRVEPGFRLFTHVLDEAGERILNLDGVGPLRKGPVESGPELPPSAWDDDKIYVDQQAFWVPPTVRTDNISIVCGLFRGAERLAITRGPQQGERARVVRLAVQRPIEPTSLTLPVMWVPRRPASSTLDIDGKLDEPAWSRAATAGPFVNVGTGEASSLGEVSGSAKLLYDEQALYVGFEVFDDDLRGGFDPSQPDLHLWLKDTVEVMIDPDGDGDGRDYYEIQVGPQNLVFDSQFDAYNLPHVEPNGPFGHQEWSANLKSAVELRGTLDDNREDEGYTVEMAIPWASLAKAKRVPPRAGDTWRMNFYAMQNNGGAAWSPILGQGNFHLASRFGRVHFAPASSAGR